MNLVNLYLNEELIESFHFPTTDVGESSTVSVIVQNPLADKVELIPFSNDPDVDVIDYPRNLKPLESAQSTWRFSPKKERLTPLKSQIGFKEIIG